MFACTDCHRRTDEPFASATRRNAVLCITCFERECDALPPLTGAEVAALFTR